MADVKGEETGALRAADARAHRARLKKEAGRRRPSSKPSGGVGEVDPETMAEIIRRVAASAPTTSASSLPADPNRPRAPPSRPTAAVTGQAHSKRPLLPADEEDGGSDLDPDDAAATAPASTAAAAAGEAPRLAERNRFNRSKPRVRHARLNVAADEEEEEEEEVQSEQKSNAAAGDGSMAAATAAATAAAAATSSGEPKPAADGSTPAPAAPSNIPSTPHVAPNIDRESEPSLFCAECCGSAAHGQSGGGVIGCVTACMRLMCGGMGYAEAVREMVKGVVIPPDWKPDEASVHKVMQSYPPGRLLVFVMLSCAVLCSDACCCLSLCVCDRWSRERAARHSAFV
jgi:hypothetical protein